ncbi:MAG: hypothetical protein HC845_15875 [Akkermansiaceae bacterium]|nr:hypothetical protein [Akkermansiaceae bacterium]
MKMAIKNVIFGWVWLLLTVICPCHAYAIDPVFEKEVRDYVSSHYGKDQFVPDSPDKKLAQKKRLKEDPRDWEEVLAAMVKETAIHEPFMGDLVVYFLTIRDRFSDPRVIEAISFQISERSKQIIITPQDDLKYSIVNSNFRRAVGDALRSKQEVLLTYIIQQAANGDKPMLENLGDYSYRHLFERLKSQGRKEDMEILEKIQASPEFSEKWRSDAKSAAQHIQRRLKSEPASQSDSPKSFSSVVNKGQEVEKDNHINHDSDRKDYLIATALIGFASAAYIYFRVKRKHNYPKG